MKEEFNIGDLLLHLDTELYYCIEARADTQFSADKYVYVFMMLNPKKPHKIRKRIIHGDEPPKIINDPNWKHYSVKE